MKNVIIILFAVIFATSTYAQCDADSYLCASGNIGIASNFVSSSNIPYVFEHKSISLSTGCEFVLFFTETTAVRLRGDIGYNFNTSSLPSVILNVGAGLLVSTREGKPYGFFEIRPRCNATRIDVNYTTASHFLTFCSFILGLGYNIPISNNLWVSSELGFVQNLTLYSSSDDYTRDESGVFLTIGVKYLIKNY